MDYYDLVFYILDLMILIMEIRMIRVSQKVEIRTNAGPRWLIPVLFWAVAAVGMFNYSGIFRIAHCSGRARHRLLVHAERSVPGWHRDYRKTLSVE